MDVEGFCVSLNELQLSQPEKAVCILWFVDQHDPGTSRSAGELSREIREAGLGSPHSTKLGDAIFRTGHVLRTGNRFRIKPTSRTTVQEWVGAIIDPDPQVEHESGFLPAPVWKGTRGYIERVAEQINGCYQFKFYDGAAVLIRRLVETLLIECYEHLEIQSKIKRNGDYPMLREIIKGAVDQGHLAMLGRNSKAALKEIKLAGDQSAHDRRYTACKADLDRLQAGVRVAIQDLLHVCGLK